MNLHLLIAMFISILPVFELRGGIPYAQAQHVPAGLAFLCCTAVNIVIIPFILLFLDYVNKHLLRIGIYKRLFDKLVARARRKAHDKVEKYGYLGLCMFVAVPLPGTGAYTGSLVAWFFNMERKRASLAIAAGVLLAGVAVTLICFLGLTSLEFFIKRV